jgi:hypothetical protein
MDELLIAKLEKEYRETADKVLFDIKRKKWNPDYKTLEIFCKGIYYEIVSMYTKLEKTQEYIFTRDLLTAKGCMSNKCLAVCIGAGSTKNEISATHSLGWELQRLMDEQKTNPEPFDLKFLIVGYDGVSDRGQLLALPQLDEAIGF